MISFGIVYHREGCFVKKEDLSRNLAASFDMPGELMTGVPKITLTGNSSILVENHSGIRGFSAERVCIGCCYGEMEIIGRDLQLRLLKKDEIEVEGEIRSVGYLGERGGKG